MKEGGNLFFGAHRRFSLRNLLIVTQVAVSLTLLVVLGLLSLGIQSTLGIASVASIPHNLYAIALDPVRDGYSGRSQAADFLEKLAGSRARALPSVTSATLTETVPVSMPGTAVTIANTRAIKHVVSKKVFRDHRHSHPFRPRVPQAKTRAGQSPSVIITEALAHELWEGQEPVGRMLEIRNAALTAPKILPGAFDYRPTVQGSQTAEVVGVAANVSEGLVVGKPRPAIYFPLGPSELQSSRSLQGITLMVRSSARRRTLLPPYAARYPPWTIASCHSMPAA